MFLATWRMKIVAISIIELLPSHETEHYLAAMMMIIIIMMMMVSANCREFLWVHARCEDGRAALPVAAPLQCPPPTEPSCLPATAKSTPGNKKLEDDPPFVVVNCGGAIPKSAEAIVKIPHLDEEVVVIQKEDFKEVEENWGILMLSWFSWC